MNSQNNINTDVLIIGNVSQAFWDISELNDLEIARCITFNDAMKMVSSQNFSRIYVIMSSFNGNLETSLEQLRQICITSRVILLSQMYEEPIAREMIKSYRKPSNPADEYHICPASAKSILPNKLFAKPLQNVQVYIEPDKIELPPVCSKPAFEKSEISVLQDTRIRELEKLATEDDLTGLKNSRYIWEFLRQIIVRGQEEGFNVTLLIFDIDNFKQYNDKFGHGVGNNVLVQTATMMKRCWREHDVVARIGGDEFAVVFWDRPDNTNNIPEQERRNKHNNEHPAEAIFIAERFRNEMNSTDLFMLGTDGQGTLTISGGLASFPRDGSNPEELFEKADKAMMEAKRSGKNRIYLVGSEDIL